jgi:GTPase SAR1 family protein
MNRENVRENRLFLGNPGTGKSTLINCLVGQRVFDSGVNWGGGLTQEYQKYVRDNIAYMDTPGLADRAIVRQAAEAIQTALSDPGTYKLFFMVRLQNGRVVSDDLATIERVLDSIDMRDIPFAILINNLGPRQYATMMRQGEEFKQVATLINSGKYTTPYIYFIPSFSALDEQDNEIIDLPNEVTDFIEHRAPSVFIPRGAVSSIDVRGFERQTQELREQIEAMRRDHFAMTSRMMELQERYGAQIESERRRHHEDLSRERRWYREDMVRYRNHQNSGSGFDCVVM